MMRVLKIAILAVAVTAFGAAITFRDGVQSQTRPGSNVDRVRREKFRHNGVLPSEAPAGEFAFDEDRKRTARPTRPGVSDDAPTGYDSLTNDYIEQGPPFNTLTEENVVPLRSYNDDRFIYEEVESIDDGLGPTYNAQSCRECHQNVVTGSSSQVTVQRTGHVEDGTFYESMGGSLIHSRSTYPDIVELVADEDDTRTFRISPSTLGDGFVEAVANSTLLAIRDQQPAEQRGMAVMVPVLEGDGSARVGRFGWKSQHGSLVSFSLDAYLNEMGITTPTLPEENTCSGLYVGYGSTYDPVEDPEDDGTDALAFADFMRATKAPSRETLGARVTAGQMVFNQLRCNVCHVASITTAPVGTIINGGAFTVPEALGNKVIHPYSDFLLHDIGTGDGIPIQPTPEYQATANRMRTAPLWGLRTRSRLMHDGLTFTLNDAILRHGGQAAQSSRDYTRLLSVQKARLIAFLKSL
jgi:CxxC motif-containing protein (DUF1111 family)